MKVTLLAKRAESTVYHTTVYTTPPKKRVRFASYLIAVHVDWDDPIPDLDGKGGETNCIS